MYFQIPLQLVSNCTRKAPNSPQQRHAKRNILATVLTTLGILKFSNFSPKINSQAVSVGTKVKPAAVEINFKKSTYRFGTKPRVTRDLDELWQSCNYKQHDTRTKLQH